MSNTESRKFTLQTYFGKYNTFRYSFSYFINMLLNFLLQIKNQGCELMEACRMRPCSLPDLQLALFDAPGPDKAAVWSRGAAQIDS